MLRRLAFGLLALAASMGIACSTLSEDSAGQQAGHTEGQTVFAAHDWLWANETYEAFAARELKGKRALPLDHPIARRTRFWLEALDREVRKEHGELASVPKPEIVVVQGDAPNGWVSSMPITWSLPIAVRADADAGGYPFDEDSDILVLDSRGRLHEKQRHPNDVLRPFDDQQVDELVAFMNAGFAVCRLSHENGALTFDPGCLPPSDYRIGRRGSAFAYNATARHVVVTTEALVALDGEAMVVALLAHELGHYYRSHVTMPMDLTNYFYSLTGEPSPKKPVPDPNFSEATAGVREKIRTFRTDFVEENRLMRNQNLGFYTTEQEADEVALELLAKVGIDPTVGVDFELAMLKSDEGRYGGPLENGTMSWETCTWHRASGFKNGGRWVAVPVGDLSDPHHSHCFRAFNQQREIEAHRYKVAAPRSPGGESWTSLVAALAREIGRPVPGADGGGK